MSELKTLFDLMEEYELRGVQHIRAEAIKHAGVLRPKVFCKCGLKMRSSYEDFISCPEFDATIEESFKLHFTKNGDVGGLDDLAVYDWIMHFFNLTEDDLK